jgi:hypothetical protein
MTLMTEAHHPPERRRRNSEWRTVAAVRSSDRRTIGRFARFLATGWIAVIAFVGPTLAQQTTTGPGDRFDISPDTNSSPQGDRFDVPRNDNSGPAGPGGDRFAGDPQCGGHHRDFYGPGARVMTSTEANRLYLEGRIGRCADCSRAGPNMVICWPSQGTLDLPKRPPIDTSPQPCPSIGPAARSAMQLLSSGQDAREALNELERAQRCLPPSAERPIGCFDLMMQAQSKQTAHSPDAAQKARDAVACYEAKGLAEPDSCNQDQLVQAAIDFNRGFFDSLTLGASKWAREQIYQEDGQIIDQQAADIGSWTELAASTLVPASAGARALSIFQWSKEAIFTADAANWMVANANLVWKAHPLVRGDVIEKVLAVLVYNPAKGYRWVGVLNNEKFRMIDFINEFAREQVSLKTVFRSNEQGWLAAERTLQKHIETLGNASKIWTEWVGTYTKQQWNVSNPACVQAAAQWKRVLEIRVPAGYESKLQNLIQYGKQYGVTVRILPWP